MLNWEIKDKKLNSHVAGRALSNTKCEAQKIAVAAMPKKAMRLTHVASND